MDYLLGVFEEAKVQYKHDPFTASGANLSWSKLDKYYTKTNDSAAYIAALVLDPCIKWEYITSTWQPEWVLDAKTQVVKLWKKYRPSSDSTTISTEVKRLNQNVSITWKHQQSARRADNTDEYFRYIREPPVPQDHIKQGTCS